jgi:quercetin dioxygenase-like cupin family protein
MNAVLIEAGDVETLDLLGPTIQILTPPAGDPTAPCVMRGTIPSGGSVPLHSHPEPESFIAISGEVEGLLRADGSFRWVTIRPGEILHVPGGVGHAWRNRSQGLAVSLAVTEESLADFFREVGTRPGTAPAPDAAQRFAEASLRRGHWLGTPEENAAVGLSAPFGL